MKFKSLFRKNHLLVRNVGLNISSGRKLITDISEEILTQINSDVKIRSSLKNYPFTSKNIHISIFFQDIDGKTIFQPDLNIISTFNDEIFYYSREAKDPLKFYTEWIEPNFPRNYTYNTLTL